VMQEIIYLHAIALVPVSEPRNRLRPGCV